MIEYAAKKAGIALDKPTAHIQELHNQYLKAAVLRSSNNATDVVGAGLTPEFVRSLSIGLNGGDPKRLTQSSSIDTEPAYSPDGKTIYFVSDRGGSPQIYRMSPSGGNAERVTFTGSYNISPAVSPDGRWLAYISRVGGAFKLHLMDLASGSVTAITDTGGDESPSFAPNSRLIVYATQQQGREALMTTTLDGKIKARLSGASGDIREPDWGPFQR